MPEFRSKPTSLGRTLWGRCSHDETFTALRRQQPLSDIVRRDGLLRAQPADLRLNPRLENEAVGLVQYIGHDGRSFTEDQRHAAQL